MARGDCRFTRRATGTALSSRLFHRRNVGGDGFVDIAGISAGEDNDHRQPGPSRLIDDDAITSSQTVERQAQSSKLILFIRVRSREIEEAFGM